MPVKQTITLQIFSTLYSATFTWSILEYFSHIDLVYHFTCSFKFILYRGKVFISYEKAWILWSERRLTQFWWKIYRNCLFIENGKACILCVGKSWRKLSCRKKRCSAVRHLKPERVAGHTDFLDLGFGVSDGTSDGTLLLIWNTAFFSFAYSAHALQIQHHITKYFLSWVEIWFFKKFLVFLCILSNIQQKNHASKKDENSRGQSPRNR